MNESTNRHNCDDLLMITIEKKMYIYEQLVDILKKKHEDYQNALLRIYDERNETKKNVRNYATSLSRDSMQQSIFFVQFLEFHKR